MQQKFKPTKVVPSALWVIMVTLDVLMMEQTPLLINFRIVMPMAPPLPPHRSHSSAFCASQKISVKG